MSKGKHILTGHVIKWDLTSGHLNLGTSRSVNLGHVVQYEPDGPG